MLLVMDSFWRAALYCLRWQVITLSFVPFLVMAGATGLAGFFFWEVSVGAVREWLANMPFIDAISGWLAAIGFVQAKAVLAPLLVVLLATPVIITLSLLLVMVFIVPRIVSLVERRRFPNLQRLQGGNWWKSLVWGLGSLLMAVGAIVLTSPLWLIPLMLLVLPPMIWGWLTARVMAYDALTDHASVAERKLIFKRHRAPLLVMGVVVGYMSAMPSLIWTLGVGALVMAPVLIPLVMIWLYTGVFVFSTLWFVHFCLAALHQMRQQMPPLDAIPVVSHIVEDAV